jgi:hypothetical protein
MPNAEFKVRAISGLTWLLAGIVWAASFLLGTPAVRAQNIVETDGQNQVLPPITLSNADLEKIVRQTPNFSVVPKRPEALRVAAKLDAHISAFLAGYPWKPFHLTLGISGHQTLFGNPDEMFYALSLSQPWLSETTAAKVRQFLHAQLEAGNLPFLAQGLDTREGRAREAYEVPNALRSPPRASTSIFGIYSFWTWRNYAGDAATVKTLWPKLQASAAPLLAKEYRFDIKKRDYAGDEAETLNGNLAGLIGLIRLAREVGDTEIEKAARARALQLLELRVNLERVNPKILEKSERSASKSLHHFKLARYCGLVPEIAGALDATGTTKTAAARLQAFRNERNGWYLAFGDRMVGGENYTNPAEFSRALFAGAALIEKVPADALLQWVDVPWCQGDFYFMEKCALALWSSAGKP